MWLMTNIGFFSIVQKPHTDFLTIRSRVKNDLESLRCNYLPELSETIGHAGTDYPWRATVSHDKFAAALWKIVSDIDYPNFKNEVAAKQGKARAIKYGKVWSVLNELHEQDVVASVAPKSIWTDTVPAGKKVAYGGVIISRSGRVLLREVKNHFDGYVWTFPKGKAEPGELPEETALRESYEETGTRPTIIVPISGDFEGGTSINRYYLMQADEDSGGVSEDDKETASICWVFPDEARRLVEQTTNSIGKKRDLAVLDAATKTFVQSLCNNLPQLTIDKGAGSKLSPVSEYQVGWLIQTIRDLERAFLPAFNKMAVFSQEDFQRFSQSSEYKEFIHACLGGGFVCDDYENYFPINLIHALPEETIPLLTLSGIRHYVHTLQRAEKWNSEYSITLFEAVRSGALALVARRFENYLSRD